MVSSKSPSSDIQNIRRLRWERLAQITSHRFGLKLAFGAGHGNDGDRVSIQLGRDPLTERGETLHEAAHLTAESLRGNRRIAELSAGFRPAEGAALHLLWHALEDARAENTFLNRYPGAELFLVSRAENDARREAEGKGLHRLVRLAWGIYETGRGTEAAHLDEDTRLAMGVIGPLVKRGVACETPEEAADTALEILRSCSPILELPKEEFTRRPDVDGDSDTREEVRIEAEGESAWAGAVEDGEQDVWTSLELEDLANLSFGGAPWLDRDAKPKEIHPDAMAPDERTWLIPPDGSLEEYLEVLAESSSEVLVMIRRLQRMIRERQYVRYAGSYRSGRLSLAKVWKQRTGNFRLFQRRVEPDRLDVAFTLLVDESGSMNRKKKFLIARQASVLCAEALEGISVPFEIIGFSTQASEAVMAHNYGHVPVFQFRHIRHSRLEHRLYKTFEDAYRTVRTRLVHLAPRFNNWDEEHLAFAARRLAGRPENVKAIIIISDGQPNGNVRHLIDAVGDLERRGFRIIAVGIEDDYVREIYPHHVVVEDMSQLAAELINLLERELLGRRR